MRRSQHGTRELLDTFTRDVTAHDLKRVFTRDARDAYEFFSLGIDRAALTGRPWYDRALAYLRLFLIAFSRRLPPARRALYGIALVCSLAGLQFLFTPFRIPAIPYELAMLTGLVLLNVLFALEVADRLSLKHDLSVAREIQAAMLPRQPFAGLGVDAHGETRPANTVGGDFFDIIPTRDGRLLVSLGDVAGKGTPAALLMALLLAMMRTLVDEGLEPDALATRLNQQVLRHAPRSRFITAFFGIYDPSSHVLSVVNAGHPPAVLARASGALERLAPRGLALGLDARAVYTPHQIVLHPGDLLVVHSDGITEAESPSRVSFDEAGVDAVVSEQRGASVQAVIAALLARVDAHIGEARVRDDLTVLALRRRQG